jgi:hypothetical protein
VKTPKKSKKISSRKKAQRKRSVMVLQKKSEEKRDGRDILPLSTK